MYQRWWLDDVWFPRYGTRQTDEWTNGRKKQHIEVGAPPKKNQYFEQSTTLFGMKTKENCKSNSLIQTSVYRSNIYHSKIYQRRNWKNNSSTLHLEVWTRYFRRKYSIKPSRTSMSLKIIRHYHCSPERFHLVLIELK